MYGYGSMQDSEVKSLGERLKKFGIDIPDPSKKAKAILKSLNKFELKGNIKKK